MLWRRTNFSFTTIFFLSIMSPISFIIKWRIQQGLGFKEFESARRTLSGIEIVRKIKTNQLIGQDKTMFKSFMSLAA